MNDQPLVSICIPTYNQQDFITEAVESCLRQSYSKIEIIIVDDASADRTVEIVRKLLVQDARLRFFQNDKNQGIEKTWNLAISLAQGGLIKLLCGDDVLMPECIEKQVGAFLKYPELGMVGCNRNIINANSEIVYTSRRSDFHSPTQFHEGFLRVLRSGTNLIGEPACVLFRSGPMRFDAEIPYMIDLDFWFKVWERGPLMILTEPLASFRIHSSSLTYKMGLGHFFQFRQFLLKTAKKNSGKIHCLDQWIGISMAFLLNFARRCAIAWCGGRGG